MNWSRCTRLWLSTYYSRSWNSYSWSSPLWRSTCYPLDAFQHNETHRAAQPGHLIIIGRVIAANSLFANSSSFNRFCSRETIGLALDQTNISNKYLQLQFIDYWPRTIRFTTCCKVCSPHLNPLSPLSPNKFEHLFEWGLFACTLSSLLDSLEL